MALPLIGLTMGDPAGVGPELCLRAAVEPSILKICRPVIFGNSWVLNNVIQACGPKASLTALPLLSVMDAEDHLSTICPNESQVYCCEGAGLDDPDGQPGSAEVGQSIQPGQVSSVTGRLSFQFVEEAIDDALSGRLQAIVTGPIHKAAWNQAGIQYPGHTEMLAEQTGTAEFCMLMASPKLCCSLVTCHIGIDRVAAQIKPARVLQVIQLTHNSLKATGKLTPKLAVLGLNPHAGEGGLFGDEEQRLIQPAIDSARELGIDVTGPLPPDTAFLPSYLEDFDAHVCMYHDQGLIPFKALAFDTGVNVTLGLPIVRTSVDHGTALDKAWQGQADPSSMLAAIRMAVNLSAAASR